jgi:cytosine/adenosine deaminase-related metal-dependent hydrolase
MPIHRRTARMRALDCGLIEVGRSADFVIMDQAQHSPGKNIRESIQLGDLPGGGMTTARTWGLRELVPETLRARNPAQIARERL